MPWELALEAVYSLPRLEFLKRRLREIELELLAGRIISRDNYLYLAAEDHYRQLVPVARYVSGLTHLEEWRTFKDRAMLRTITDQDHRDLAAYIAAQPYVIMQRINFLSPTASTATAPRAIAVEGPNQNQKPYGRDHATSRNPGLRASVACLLVHRLIPETCRKNYIDQCRRKNFVSSLYPIEQYFPHQEAECPLDIHAKILMSHTPSRC